MVTTELLRDELGFKGVILEMNAVAANHTTQKGAVLSLRAGADIVMICHIADRGYRGNVQKGELSQGSEEKARFVGTWESVFADCGSEREE